jgi:hypothetical protein
LRKPSFLASRRGVLPILLSGLLSATIAGSLIPTAAQAKPASDRAEVQAQIAQVRDRLMQLSAGNASTAEIERALGLRKVSKPGSQFTTLSSNSAVTITAPNIFYDRDTKHFYATSTYRWKNQQQSGDPDTGGLDGLAIRFSRDVRNLGASASICWGQWFGAKPYPARPGCIKPAKWSNSENGATFRFQDEQRSSHCSGSDHPSCHIYLGASGTISFSFNLLDNKCLQAFSQFAHTWDSTGLTSFEVSNVGFNAVFSKTSDFWQRTSSAGAYNC